MKNIVLLTFDSLRADHCGYCGYDRDTTPNMDELAMEGIAFTNAVSPASRTNPSMAGIFTGEHLVTRGKVSNPKHSKYHLERHGTLAEELSNRGYTTGAFCPNAYSSRYYGFDRGFDTFEDFLFSEDQYQKLFDKHITNSSIYTTLRNIRNLIRKEEAFRTWETYIDDMVDWANNQDDPYFLWGFSLDTHFPYITPRKHRKWSNTWGNYYYNWRCNQLLDEYDVDMSDRDIDGITDIYDDSIRYADKLLGELRDRLNEDTVFIVCADHGEALGERGLYGHFYPSLYEENIHVPLVIGGDIDQSDLVTSPISLVQLPDIISELTDEWTGSSIENNWALSSTYDGYRQRNLISIRLENWKFHNNDGLYSLESGIEDEKPIKNEELSKQLKNLSGRRDLHEKEMLEVRNVIKSNTKI